MPADREPSWSPDGQRSLSHRPRRQRRGLHDDSGRHGRPASPTTSSTDSEPAWSPDASKILFRSSRDGNAEIYVMGTGGAAQTRLTNIPQFDGHPDWQALVPGIRARRARPSVRHSCRPTRDAVPPAMCTARRSASVLQSACTAVRASDRRDTAMRTARRRARWVRRHIVRRRPPGLPEDSDHHDHVLSHRRALQLAIITCAGGGLSRLHGRACEVATDMRITDRNNAATPGGGREAATVIDSALAFAAPCAGTAGASGANLLSWARPRDAISQASIRRYQAHADRRSHRCRCTTADPTFSCDTAHAVSAGPAYGS